MGLPPHPRWLALRSHPMEGLPVQTATGVSTPMALIKATARWRLPARHGADDTVL